MTFLSEVMVAKRLKRLEFIVMLLTGVVSGESDQATQDKLAEVAREILADWDKDDVAAGTRRS